MVYLMAETAGGETGAFNLEELTKTVLSSDLYIDND